MLVLGIIMQTAYIILHIEDIKMELILILKRISRLLFWLWFALKDFKNRSTTNVDFAKAILQLPLISQGTELQTCVSIHVQGTLVTQIILFLSIEIY